ncbi:MAG: UDP-N-acetylmuramate dehydrogenase [Ruminococcus sp.]|nr:UDP-N-acetylmuramate dehydrogenase [Ruminococcus sp.]
MTYDAIERVKRAAAECGCEILENTELKRHTTFGIGGTCPLLAEINGADALKNILKALAESGTPYYIIGRGSNLLVSDGDIDMVFLRIGKDCADVSAEEAGGRFRVICGAGAPLSAVSAFARDNGLTGMEFAYGIPGSVGGAVYMNAGAYGSEIKDIIEYVLASDKNGNIHVFNAEDMDMGYRKSVFASNKFIVIKAAFLLKKGNKEDIAAKMRELTEKRKEKQPLEYRSAGSTFKRPEGTFAALLIEQCGLKGYSCGDAQVSEKHSGFVINKGNASFADVMAVIDHVRQTVYSRTGIMLECEPEIISGK